MLSPEMAITGVEPMGVLLLFLGCGLASFKSSIEESRDCRVMQEEGGEKEEEEEGGRMKSLGIGKSGWAVRRVSSEMEEAIRTIGAITLLGTFTFWCQLSTNTSRRGKHITFFIVLRDCEEWLDCWG